MGFFAALQFLTIIPSPIRRAFSTEELGKASGYFPLVGLLLGLVLAGLDWALGLVLPPLLVSALVIVLLVIITGALHLDGLIDTCDGLAPRSSAEERLRIMSDSRTGSFGVVGACCLLLLKFASLASLSGPLRLAALVLMPMLARWVVVVAISAYPYARKASGMGLIFKQQASSGNVALATVTAVVLSIAISELWGLILMAWVCLIMLPVAGYLKSRLSGLTGDTYGAIIELAELAVLFFFSIYTIFGGVNWLGFFW